MVDQKVRLRRYWRGRRQGRIRPAGEAEGLRQGWIQLLAQMGFEDRNMVLPALFTLTASEPDISGIWSEHSRFLLPSLVDSGGQVLPNPSWSMYEGGARLSQPNPKWPAQVDGPPLGPEALGGADMVAVPALAIDAAGTRLGQGGGWYDRALSYCRDDALIIGIVDAQAFIPEATLPREAHDIPIHAVLTPQGFSLLHPSPAEEN